MERTLALVLLLLALPAAVAVLAAPPAPELAGESAALRYHLMHPGGPSIPGDPNAAFCLNGVYHLHYILAHPWRGGTSFSFVHVTSPDLLHWTWQPTTLQPAFTGHGMFSGTGFTAPDGRPAVVYHGQGSGRNYIATAKDARLSGWDAPVPLDLREPDGREANVAHWDPDYFRVGDTHYTVVGGENPPLFKSKDLKTWVRVGPFLKSDLPDVTRGEDISCPNFFRLGDKWVLLCISHDLGCRYYVGDWDERAEQFVPAKHGRMNWRRDGQSFFGRHEAWRADVFAPETALTPDGRRVMWAWLASADRADGRMSDRTILSLPRELSLPADGALRVRPLRELETLRHTPTIRRDVAVPAAPDLRAEHAPAGTPVATLPGESAELRVVVARAEAERKLFGLTLFADGKGGGLPIILRPETGSIRVGTTEAPFALADLPPGEDVELRVFVDRYLVEVFVNDRQALVATHGDYAGRSGVSAFSVGAPTALKSVEAWGMTPTDAGFRAARDSRVWEPLAK